jgi:hypothetical protein
MTDIPDPGPRGRRYTTRALPPYRYVPGRHPHPTRDPRGHSYEPEPKLNRHGPWQPEDWRDLEDWLYGIDLFNAFYFWEAHEAWEGLWAAAERESAPALLLQGLIQIAAALLKAHMGVDAGAFLLSREGIEKLRHAAAEQPRLMGLDVKRIAEVFADYFGCSEAGGLPIPSRVPLLQLESEDVEE